MADGTPVPASVQALADERAQARAGRDFVLADELRARIAEAGFVVTDTPAGYALAPRPPYPVHASLAEAVAAAGAPRSTCTVALIVDGWADDARVCIESVIQHCPVDIPVLALDTGNVDGAGDTLHALVSQHPGRVIGLHVAAPVGWAAAVTALLEASSSPLVAVMDVSTRFDGDGLTPLLSPFTDPTVVATGWRGVDLAEDWRSFDPAPAGDVDAVLGYLLVVRREEALAAPPHPKARFYRNADMEWSLALRAGGGRIVVPSDALPVRQERHHGYHDTDPEYRDRESRRTYDRLLSRFRNRPGMRHAQA